MKKSYIFFQVLIALFTIIAPVLIPYLVNLILK